MIGMLALELFAPKSFGQAHSIEDANFEYIKYETQIDKIAHDSDVGTQVEVAEGLGFLADESSYFSYGIKREIEGGIAQGTPVVIKMNNVKNAGHCFAEFERIVFGVPIKDFDADFIGNPGRKLTDNAVNIINKSADAVSKRFSFRKIDSFGSFTTSNKRAGRDRGVEFPAGAVIAGAQFSAVVFNIKDPIGNCFVRLHTLKNEVMMDNKNDYRFMEQQHPKGIITWPREGDIWSKTVQKIPFLNNGIPIKKSIVVIVFPYTYATKSVKIKGINKKLSKFTRSINTTMRIDIMEKGEIFPIKTYHYNSILTVFPEGKAKYQNP